MESHFQKDTAYVAYIHLVHLRIFDRNKIVLSSLDSYYEKDPIFFHSDTVVSMVLVI